MKTTIRLICASTLLSSALAGPYPPAAGQPGSDAIAAADSRFTLWATNSTVERGPTEIGYPGSNYASYGIDSAAIGSADATPESPYPVVSLGDGGTATLEFATPFGDIPGPDFAVFENSFASSFLELAHVEVSSDGIHYFRFPSSSLTIASATLGEGGSVDPTDIRNLAGKYIAGYGTPFDLSEMRNVSPLLDVQRITHVRIIDAVGTNDPTYASTDASGHIVIDPYPTPYFSGGFDLDATGAFSATTTTFAAWKSAHSITASDPAADSNHDGVPNLIEYLTGNGRLTLSFTPAGAATLQLTRLAYRSDANLRIEGSSDLQQWTTLAQSIQGASLSPVLAGTTVSETGDAAKQVTLTPPTATTYKFFRLAADP